MIRKLTGRISDVTNDEVILDVNGVGFQVAVPTNQSLHLVVGDELTLHTHLAFSNDQFSLQGFENFVMLQIFKLLLTVNGVGVKAGMSLLGSLTASQLVQSIKQQQASRLVEAPGIGKKTAERIVLELRDKVEEIEITITDTEDVNESTTDVRDATDALISLGYNRRDALRAVESSWQDEIDLPELIRAALQRMKLA